MKGTPAGITKEALKEGYQWDMTEDAAAKGDPEQTVFYGSSPSRRTLLPLRCAGTNK